VHFGEGLQRYNSPAAKAGKLFKPSTDSASLLVEIEKNVFVLGLGLSEGDVTSGGVFAIFGLFCVALDVNPMSQFFRSKLLCKLDYQRSL